MHIAENRRTGFRVLNTLILNLMYTLCGVFFNNNVHREESGDRDFRSLCSGNINAPAGESATQIGILHASSWFSNAMAEQGSLKFGDTVLLQVGEPGGYVYSELSR